MEEMENPRYWHCIIGPIERGSLPAGSNSPLRSAVRQAYRDTAGKEEEHCWSGWGCTEEGKEKALTVICQELGALDDKIEETRNRGRLEGAKAMQQEYEKEILARIEEFPTEDNFLLGGLPALNPAEVVKKIEEHPE